MGFAWQMGSTGEENSSLVGFDAVYAYSLPSAQSVLMRYAPEFARVHAEAGDSSGLWRVQTSAVRAICVSKLFRSVIPRIAVC
jgi:hypothetical protein